MSPIASQPLTAAHIRHRGEACCERSAAGLQARGDPGFLPPWIASPSARNDKFARADSRTRGARCATRRQQAGAAAVEFALIALFAFLPMLLAIVELGRLFYVVNTTQEVTRRAARAQVVSWLSQSGAVQRYAVFRAPGTGSVTLPGGVEVNSADVRLTFYGTYADAVNGTNLISGGTPQSNLGNCIKNVDPCIRFVRASLQTAAGGPVTYAPMVGWFGTLLEVPLPGATVIMPAEALGIL